MTSFLTCRDYTIIARALLDCPAPALCAQLEEERADGYAVVACQDGRIVADAEGWHEREGAATDAATATGMYDHD